MVSEVRNFCHFLFNSSHSFLIKIHQNIFMKIEKKSLLNSHKNIEIDRYLIMIILQYIILSFDKFRIPRIGGCLAILYCSRVKQPY